MHNDTAEQVRNRENALGLERVSSQPFSRASIALLVIGSALALAFWISVPFRPFPGSYLLKWLPIGCLAAVALGRKSWLLGAALLFHSVGDVLLDLNRTGLFVPAIGGFLAGHLLYIAAFWKDVRTRTRWSGSKAWMILGLGVYAIGMSILLVPRLDAGMIAPVLVYIVAIALMTTATFLPDYRVRWMTFGALLYMVSDSLIGLNAFVVEIPGSAYLTWPTYFLGQLLILLGWYRRG